MFENAEPTTPADDAPTTAANVTPDTPLDSLNMNWRERDLPERERTKHVHRLHPYLGKFIPQIAEIFLRKHFTPGRIVLDPFSGSGTTLVQAKELGIHSLGMDISAFNVLLGGVKTADYDAALVNYEVSDILEKTKKALGAEQRLLNGKEAQMNLWEEESSDADFPPSASATPESAGYLCRWFAPQALRELVTYRETLGQGGYQYADLMRVILSRAARSARLTTHFDLDFPKAPQTEPYWCYKHSRHCSPTTQALHFLERYSKDAVRRIIEYNGLAKNVAATVNHADSRNAAIPPIDGVLTSPPYVGLIDYHAQHAYAYHLLGLEDKSEQEVGAARRGSSQRAQTLYKQDIAAVLQNALNSMPSGGPMIVIAGDKFNLYSDIALALNVDVEVVLQRHVNRRTGRRAGEFYESIFIWRKK